MTPLLLRVLWALLLLLALGGRARSHPAATAATRVDAVGCAGLTVSRPLAAAASGAAASR